MSSVHHTKLVRDLGILFFLLIDNSYLFHDYKKSNS